MMSQEVKVTDISTMFELDKKWQFEQYKRGLDKNGQPDDELIKFYEDRFPGLIEEMSLKESLEPPQKFIDNDCSEFFENYHRDLSPEEIDEMERSNQESDEEERKNYLLYDHGSKQKILYPDCIRKYGRIITDKMYQADNKNSGTVDLETWKQIQDIHKGKVRKQSADKAKTTTPVVVLPEPEIIVPDVVEAPIALIQRQRVKGDDYYIVRERGIVKNEHYRRLSRKLGRSVVYEYLWANLVRKNWIDYPGYPIKAQYYNNGDLAYCTSIKHIADECFLDKKTVEKILKEFSEAKIIRVEHIVPDGKKHGQTVAILGEWRTIILDGVQKPVERYYLDEVFLEPPANLPFQFKKLQ